MAKLLDRVRERVRVLHDSIRIEDAYVEWIRRFILFHGKRHPEEMGAPEREAFLTHLAVDRNVTASTQNQALSAILFLYRQVLDRPLQELGRIASARQPERLPTVLTRDEVRSALAQLDGSNWLMAGLLYGSRLQEDAMTRMRGTAPEREPPAGNGPLAPRPRPLPATSPMNPTLAVDSRSQRPAMDQINAGMHDSIQNPQIPTFLAHFLYLQDASALQFLECTYRRYAKKLATMLDLD